MMHSGGTRGFILETHHKLMLVSPEVTNAFKHDYFLGQVIELCDFTEGTEGLIFKEIFNIFAHAKLVSDFWRTRPLMPLNITAGDIFCAC